MAEEVQGVAIEPDAAMAVLPRLVRTRAVVSEAMRLYPPAFTMVREAIGPDRLGDFDLPRRALLMISPCARCCTGTGSYGVIRIRSTRAGSCRMRRQCRAFRICRSGRGRGSAWARSSR